MILGFVPIVSCLIIMFFVIAAGYIFLPQYTKNSGIFKVTFKSGKDNKYLQGDDPFIIKSNKIILVPLLIIPLVHIFMILSLLTFDFNQAAPSHSFITVSLIMLILLILVGAVFFGLNLSINIYQNGLVIKSFFYNKTLFFCDLERLEINYLGGYKKTFNNNRPIIICMHHYYSIITQERKFIDLYPLLFGKLEALEDVLNIHNPYVEAVVQNPPRSVTL